MDQFTKLFGSLLALVYHCFDRVVILGHLPLLTRPENIVHFFRDVHGVGALSKEVLRQRTTDYQQWVEAFARNHQIPLEWAEKGVRKEDYVRPRLRQMERQQRFGVYFILKSMEVGANFRVAVPKYPTADPNYRIVARQRSRYTHYYFYIRDPVLGPLALCVASFLPFSITYYRRGRDAGLTQRPPPRSVRAGLLHTAPTSDTWRRSAGRDGDVRSWHSGSSDRPTARTAPTSSGHADCGAAVHGTNARLAGPESCSDYPCCRALHGS